MRKEYVYLIQDGDQLKIGRSYDPKVRLFQLRMEKTKNMKVISQIELDNLESAIQLEKRLLTRFSFFNVRGEWFENVPIIHSFFQKLGGS